MSLMNYARRLVADAHKTFASGQVFAKVLTPNDDSGKHGVVIPADAYSFFPSLPIPDVHQNWTETFSAFNSIARSSVVLAHKYYERYPERRITRLHSILNDRENGPRLLVFLDAKHTDGTSAYYFDCANSAPGGRFHQMFQLIFGDELAPIPKNFIIRPVDSDAYSADIVLTELLCKFDQIKEMGYIDTRRIGDTGIGYTFETLLGIKENNDQTADFKGIEIKCKGVNEEGYTKAGKINLFQVAPTWIHDITAKERIRILGCANDDGLYSCYSQVTTTANNLGLLLQVLSPQSKIDLLKNANALGFWTFEVLASRLAEKHSRAAFVKVKVRKTKTKTL